MHYSTDELRDLYELREMIDGLAARLLAVHGPSKAVTRQMAKLLADMDEASEPFRSSAWFAAHTAFHVSIGVNCGNSRLQSLISVIRSTSMALHAPMVEHGATETDDLSRILKVGREQHHAIFDAIVAGDGRAAEQTARRHILSTLRSDLIRRATVDRESGSATGDTA